MIRTILVSGLALMVACSTNSTTTARFYPVEGPLAVSASVLVATVSGVGSNNGLLSMQMPNAILCNGEWSSAAGAGVVRTSSSGTATSSDGSLISVYGSTVGVSRGSGQNPGQAIMLCGDGRQIQIEFVTGAGTASGFGVAKDNRGNLYKVLF